MTKADNRLYALATLGTPWPQTQNPGLPLLSYFFQFLGHYADWKIYVAYDVLAAAVFAAVLGGLNFRQYRIAVPLAAICWFAPWFLTVYNHTIYLDTTYMTAYGDVPAGLALGGAVALWLALRKTGGPKWAVLPVLALAANIKANTFVLSLVAAGLMAVDAWLFAEHPFKKGLARRTGFAIACFAAPMLIYYFWNIRYVGILVAKSASEGGTGETSAPLSAVVINGIKILLGQPVEGFYAERQSQFTQAMADMGHQFWTSDGRLSMIGQGRNVVVLILLVFLVAAICARGRQLKLRIGCIGVLSLACFVGYNLMLALSYGFIFKPDQAVGLVDYNRYIYTYYIGWFFMALACDLLVAIVTLASGSTVVICLYTLCTIDSYSPFSSLNSLTNCLDLTSFDRGHSRLPLPPESKIMFMCCFLIFLLYLLLLQWGAFLFQPQPHLDHILHLCQFLLNFISIRTFNTNFRIQFFQLIACSLIKEGISFPQKISK